MSASPIGLSVPRGWRYLSLAHHYLPESTTGVLVISTSDTWVGGRLMDGWDHHLEADGVNEAFLFSASPFIWFLWASGRSL